jgi:hypothetical protein
MGKTDQNYDGSTPLPDSQHEAFAQNLFNQGEGQSVTEAYHLAYPDCKRGAAKVSGSRLLTKANVKARVQWLKAQIATSKILSVQRRKELMSDAGERLYREKQCRDGLLQLQELNKMEGAYAPEKREISLGVLSDDELTDRICKALDIKP